VGGWGGREWVKNGWGSGGLCFWRGEGGARGWRACVVGGVEVLVLIVGGEGGCLSRVGRFGIRKYQKYGLGVD